MTDLVTPESIVAEIEMTRSASNNVVIALEGEHDEIILKKFFNLKISDIVVCYGKENAIKAINILNEEGKITGYLGIVDSDFERITGLSNIKNVIFSEFHDFEVSMIKSNCFNRVLDEYSTDKIECLKLDGKTVQEYLFDKMYILSLIKYLNKVKYKSLCFRDINYQNFICMNSLVIDKDKCIQEIHNNTINKLNERIRRAESKEAQEGLKSIRDSLPTKALIKSDLTIEEVKVKYTLEQVSNGHDIITLFSIALRKKIGSLDKRIADPDNIHRIFRLAYDRDDFTNSQHHHDIIAWEKANQAFLI